LSQLKEAATEYPVAYRNNFPEVPIRVETQVDDEIIEKRKRNEWAEIEKPVEGDEATGED